MEIAWNEHKGKKILVVDYTGIKMEKEMIAHVENTVAMLHGVEKGTEIKMLVDLTGCYVTPGFLDASKKREREIVDQFKVKRAVLGITGPKAILLKGYNLFAKQKLEPFNSKEAALDYLVRA